VGEPQGDEGMSLNKAMERIHDGYASTMRELSRVVEDLADHVELNKRVWLRKIGLQPYAPMRAAFGTAMLLLLGAALGALAGLALAPMPGAELRSGVRHRARRLVRKSDHDGTQSPAEA
jgi:hypothetical protein